MLILNEPIRQHIGYYIRLPDISACHDSHIRASSSLVFEPPFSDRRVQLEYFGRPLGLWHTSWKLAYTLLEVVFICTWSAALALSFDNFFTSLIPCASETSISWYSKLPRPVLPNGVNSFEGGVGDTLCDDQVALICLVGVGLMMYCFNLFISLFRIFEKVKYHPTSVLTA